MENKFIVQFDCTDRLEKALLSIAEGLNALNKGTVVSNERTETTQQQEVSVIEDTKPAETQVVQQVAEEPEEIAKEMPEPKVAEISDEDLRSAMNACRKRILGDKIGDAILKKTVNSLLRDKVKKMGYSVSTDLPQELRVDFLNYCATLTMDTDDKAPF